MWSCVLLAEALAACWELPELLCSAPYFLSHDTVMWENGSVIGNSWSLFSYSGSQGKKMAQCRAMCVVLIRGNQHACCSLSYGGTEVLKNQIKLIHSKVSSQPKAYQRQYKSFHTLCWTGVYVFF